MLAKKRASRRMGQSAPGGSSRYALKQAGKVQREYRLEGGYLLDPAYMRVHRMPGPFVVTTIVTNEEERAA